MQNLHKSKPFPLSQNPCVRSLNSMRWQPTEIVHRLYQKKKSLSTDDDDGEILTETQKLLRNVLSQEESQSRRRRISSQSRRRLAEFCKKNPRLYTKYRKEDNGAAMVGRTNYLYNHHATALFSCSYQGFPS